MALKVVFDSNFYVAAAANPGGYADTWLGIAATPQSAMTLFVSAAILNEVSRKLTDKFSVDPDEAATFVQRIRRASTFVTPREKVNQIAEDPDDNAILECALAARAHLIVSADHDLLRLGQFRGIGICHPRDLKYIFAQDYGQAA